MNGRHGTFSPASADGSEWSGISRYQNNGPPNFAPNPNARGNLATPPISGSSNGIQGHGRLSNGMSGRPGEPSPPNSVGRSSYGTNMSEGQRRKTLQMEENLAQHYAILKRYLAQSLRDDKGIVKPNRARDKLLRLSPVQFMELSTDVYDELLRRQSAAGQQTNGPGQVPSYLLPKENFHPKRNQARQKLATLPPPRFRDLATDVFYELERRFPRFAGGGIDRNGSPAPHMRGPPSRQGTPNGVRPGQSPMVGPGRPTLGPDYGPRTASLGSQVMAGQGIPGVEGDPYGRPTAKTFQSNTIIPNKSTLVEDDDEQTGAEDILDGRSFRSRRDTNGSYRTDGGRRNDGNSVGPFELQAGDLRGKIGELENRVREKEAQLERFQGAHSQEDNAIEAERQEWAGLRSDLESKLASAMDLNKNLKSEIDRARQNHADSERQLRSEMDQILQQGNGSDDWKVRYENLDRAHQQLQGDLRQQQKVTGEVKNEATTFLREMKNLSERSNQNAEREEKLVRQVYKLEEEVKEWRNRYTKVKSQPRTLRAPSMSSPTQQPDVDQLLTNRAFLQTDGLVRHVHATRFQISIDELLKTARTSEPSSVLNHVRSVVITARDITQDTSRMTPSNDEEAQQINKLKSRISATANNLITAAKNFAVADGLSPVSLLDAAASHLTTSIIELIRIVKIRPGSPGEPDDEDDNNSLIAESPAVYYGMDYARGSVGDESVYSAVSPAPPALPSKHDEVRTNPYAKSGPAYLNGVTNGGPYTSGPRKGLGISAQEAEVEELKAFLEDQTDGLVQSIQALVGSIRAEDNAVTIKDHINAIASVLGRVVSESQQTLSNTGHRALQEQAQPTVESLADCRTRLLEANVDMDKINDARSWKEFTKMLPPLAFQVARETKELVQRLDRIGGADDDDDDFR
ncbi:MAG: hypothetical protein Q9191_003618 [Dirinaria sp. TL-2023a]